MCKPNFLFMTSAIRPDSLAQELHLDVLQFCVFRHSRHRVSIPVYSTMVTHSSKIFTTLNTVTTISTALYPCSQSSFSFSIALSTAPVRQARMMACATIRWGWSHNLNTLSPETNPNPEHVDCKLLIAWRISPSEVKIRAVKPSSLYCTCTLLGDRWILLKYVCALFPFHKSPIASSALPGLSISHIAKLHTDFVLVQLFSYSCCMQDKIELYSRIFPSFVEVPVVHRPSYCEEMGSICMHVGNKYDPPVCF